jgi:hypothetical protein
MASIRKEFSLKVSADRVWDVLRDFGAVHTRLAPGLVTDTKLDGNARIVTFANGSAAREELVTMDDARHRLVYIIRSEPLQHHNASAEVVPGGAGCRFVWTTDVLPDEIAPYISGQMDAGVAAMRKALEK